MAIEAPVSRYKKTNFKIYIIVCAGLAVWFAYDGYFNENFKKNHVNADGKPDSTLVFNQHSPYYLGGAALVLITYFWAIKDRKLVADESELRIGGGDTIKYDAIESIDKTRFADKGYFVIAYKDERGKPAHKELSDRNWDHLAAVLDHLVAKIS
jgi:hypothetical protein